MRLKFPDWNYDALTLVALLGVCLIADAVVLAWHTPDFVRSILPALLAIVVYWCTVIGGPVLGMAFGFKLRKRGFHMAITWAGGIAVWIACWGLKLALYDAPVIGVYLDRIDRLWPR